MPGGEGGGRLFMENSQRGGGALPGRWGGSSGREGVCREFGGVGAKFFFFGAEIPAKKGNSLPEEMFLEYSFCS